MLEVIATDSGKSLVSLLVVRIGSSCTQALPATVVFEIPWDGLHHSYAFYVRIRMNISERHPMHDSSTISANLSDTVVGKPVWPLINDIESIFSVAS